MKEKHNMEMTKTDLIAGIGDFTWLFCDLFFVETSDGNFIWSDPEYKGDNTFRFTSLTYAQYIKKHGPDFGRDKGKHIISEYCGYDVVVYFSDVERKIS